MRTNKEIKDILHGADIVKFIKYLRLRAQKTNCDSNDGRNFKKRGIAGKMERCGTRRLVYNGNK